MKSWLVKKRPLGERMIAVGLTLLVLSLAGPILAAVFSERTLANAKLMMISGSIVGLICTGVGLVVLAKNREGRDVLCRTMA